MSDRLKDEPASLFDVGVSATAVAMFLSAIADELGPAAAGRVRERVERSLTLMTDASWTDWTDGQAARNLELLLTYWPKASRRR